ncbi:MAG TPA: response regulator transcription factor [Chloroflexota bacterium]|nr:response regulator transcription factor [Chloroflexota bacterium]
MTAPPLPPPAPGARPGALEILVVEDDRKTADLVRLYLEREGYRVRLAADGQTALDLARRSPPALVVLDLMLPRVDGLDVCFRLRAASGVPIIVLTARSAEEDRLLGLDLGADDYVTKPFSPRELVARIRAVLRRAAGPAAGAEDVLRLGDAAVDFRRYEATRAGRAVHLTATEFRLLRVLSATPGRAFSRAELVQHALGMDYDGLERTVDVHVMNLRKKLEADPRRPVHLVTVLGVGYKLIEEPHVPAG